MNQRAVENAKRLIDEGRVLLDKHGDWDEVNPGTEAQNKFIEEHGFEEYGQWHLGFKDGASREDKSSYSFPYGDFHQVVRSGLIAAGERAQQYHHEAIKAAADELLQMLPQD